jgi:hypothetical protein
MLGAPDREFSERHIKLGALAQFKKFDLIGTISALEQPWCLNIFYIITLRIHAISLVESHDLLKDRRTELRH